jgi:TPR repeat protein
MKETTFEQLIDSVCKGSLEAYERLRDCLKNKVDINNQPQTSSDEEKQILRALMLRAQKGNAAAMAILGNVYLKGWCDVSPDIPAAMSYAKRSASLGNPGGEVLLGLAYMEGFSGGVVRDYERAIYWFKRALEKGNSMAANNLGVMYEEGWGVKKEMNIALKYFRQAAEQNNSLAQKNLERLGK